MTPDEFNKVLEERLESIRSTLSHKADEYAGAGEDRLHNFKVAARVYNESPLQAAWGMALKHLVCIIDMVKGDLEIETHLVYEKFGDMINYLILMEALCLEEVGDE